MKSGLKSGKLTFAGRQFFFNTGCFTSQATQVVQFRAANVTTASHFDFFNVWRVQLESTFNAFAARDFAYDEVAVQATVTTGDYHAFVSLQAATGTLYHTYRYDYGVARCKFRDFFVQTSDFLLL